MDENKAIMEELGGVINKIFSDFFIMNNFVYEKSQVSSSLVEIYFVYSSPNCKICFLFSKREFELNCLFTNSNDVTIPPLDEKKWIYYREFLFSESEVSVEQLTEQVPENFITFEEELTNIREALFNGYATIILPKLNLLHKA